MRFISLIFLSLTFTLRAQYAIKIKKEDNRFLFYKNGVKTDTLFRNDLFYVHFPDSIQHDLMLTVYNGQLVKNDSLFRFVSVQGMKYSLSKPDNSYITLLEGICPASRTVRMEIRNIQTNTLILQNNFIIK